MPINCEQLRFACCMSQLCYTTAAACCRCMLLSLKKTITSKNRTGAFMQQSAYSKYLVNKCAWSITVSGCCRARLMPARRVVVRTSVSLKVETARQGYSKLVEKTTQEVESDQTVLTLRSTRCTHDGSNACPFETVCYSFLGWRNEAKFKQHSSRHALHWKKDSLCIVACSHRIERAHTRPTTLQEVLVRLTAAWVDVQHRRASCHNVALVAQHLQQSAGRVHMQPLTAAAAAVTTAPLRCILG
eukprot:11497-Heterococcus_DN1.PRE.2